MIVAEMIAERTGGIGCAISTPPNNRCGCSWGFAVRMVPSLFFDLPA